MITELKPIPYTKRFNYGRYELNCENNRLSFGSNILVCVGEGKWTISIKKSDLTNFIGHLSEQKLEELKEAIRIALAVE